MSKTASIDPVIEELKAKIKGTDLGAKFEEVGVVTQVGDGIAKIYGLDNVAQGEMISFPNDIMGVALNLEEDLVGTIIFGDYEKIQEGDTVKRTKKILEVPVGESLIGRVLDGLGKPIDGKGDLNSKESYPIERVAAGVITRKSVSKPLQTGIKAIDAMIPIGRGQRELIIGDRQTGKTAIAIDTILNQHDQNVICIYVSIGQKDAKTAKIVSRLQKEGAMDYTIVVNAAASDSASMLYAAPYAAVSMAEYFMDKGRDVLIIYDDLSKQAAAYRQVSLLLRRPPGREAYPGDVFYLHSRLLERAACMDKKYGGGSITALPIIETQAGDVSAYIPTNVISITDGQIFLENDLFYKGQRPAINAGLSVSRVGSSAQIKAMKKVAGKMRLDIAQFRELESFAQFASDLDEGTKSKIKRGERMLEILKQDQYSPLAVERQVLIIFVANEGLLDDIDLDKVGPFEESLLKFFANEHQEVLDKIKEEKDLSDETKSQIKKYTEEFKKQEGFSKS